jgi:hypothetical protein
MLYGISAGMGTTTSVTATASKTTTGSLTGFFSITFFGCGFYALVSTVKIYEKIDVIGPPPP